MLKHTVNNKACTNPVCWCRENAPETNLSIMVEDMVNHPKHYKINIKGAHIEVTELIESVLSKEEYIGYLKGNILKYHIRARAKNGLEDIKKANFYSKILDKLIC
jgi:hypothetical protein